jgi:hypothetical protein
MSREYIYQAAERVFVWLLVDTDDTPIAGGSTASREKAEQRLLKAKQEHQ